MFCSARDPDRGWRQRGSESLSWAMPAWARLLAGLAVAASAAPPTASVPSDEAIMGHLNETITWYRQQMTQVQLANGPADLVFASVARQSARQILQLAFAFARAEAPLVPDQGLDKTPASPSGPATALARTTSEMERAQAAVESIEHQLGQAAGRSRKLLQSQLAEAKSELQLAQARHDTIAGFATFMSQVGSEAGGGGLLSRIEELQRSVPEAAGEDSGTPQMTGPAKDGGAAGRPAPSGLLALTSDLLSFESEPVAPGRRNRTHRGPPRFGREGACTAP